MNTTLAFDFIVDKETSTITVKKEFAAKRQLVWDCHTKAEYLDQWFAPKPYKTNTKSMDLRDAGHWLAAMVAPDGSKHWFRWDFKKIKPIDGYSLTDSFCDEAGTINPQLPGSTWNVKFNDLGDHTMVQTDVKFASLEALETSIKMGMKKGLTMTIGNLDELLAKLTK
jgi:uncharacterized protein YndB with AHSA1/START domain